VGQQQPPGPIADLDEVRDLLGRAAGGDPEALPELRSVLDRRPELWRRLGDLAAHVELAWVTEVAGTNAALAEMLTRKVSELKRELGGPAPSPLERLLIDRIAACWLQIHHADLAAARPVDATAEGRERLRKRHAAAERRYSGAIEALARVRWLLPTGGMPGPGSGEQPQEPGAVEGEPVDVVPFATATQGRRTARRGAQLASDPPEVVLDRPSTSIKPEYRLESRQATVMTRITSQSSRPPKEAIPCGSTVILPGSDLPPR